MDYIDVRVAVFLMAHAFCVKAHDYMDGNWHCGSKEIWSTAPFSLASPGYPNGYGSDLDLCWEIYSYTGKTILANIVDLQLMNNCTTDFIEFRDGLLPTSPLIKKLCGILKPHSFSGTVSSMYVRFYSRHGSSGPEPRGFNITFYAVDVKLPTDYLKVILPCVCAAISLLMTAVGCWIIHARTMRRDRPEKRLSWRRNLYETEYKETEFSSTRGTLFDTQFHQES